MPVAILLYLFLYHAYMIQWSRGNKTEFRAYIVVKVMVCFFFRTDILLQRWPTCHLVDLQIFAFFSVTAEWILTKLERKQILNGYCQYCFTCRPRNKDCRPDLISWHISGFSYVTVKRILTKLDRGNIICYPSLRMSVGQSVCNRLYIALDADTV